MFFDIIPRRTSAVITYCMFTNTCRGGERSSMPHGRHLGCAPRDTAARRRWVAPPPAAAAPPPAAPQRAHPVVTLEQLLAGSGCDLKLELEDCPAVLKLPRRRQFLTVRKQLHRLDSRVESLEEADALCRELQAC